MIVIHAINRESSSQTCNMIEDTIVSQKQLKVLSFYTVIGLSMSWWIR